MLTGDTLFIGDIGRPDLRASLGWSAEQLASMLYDSLHQSSRALPDDTLVYPAHSAGSLCGKSLSTDRVSTIGAQRLYNYALQPMSRERSHVPPLAARASKDREALARTQLSQPAPGADPGQPAPTIRTSTCSWTDMSNPRGLVRRRGLVRLRQLLGCALTDRGALRPPLGQLPAKRALQLGSDRELVALHQPRRQ